MNITSKIEHKCIVDAEISHTTFEWALTHWSLLVEDYENGVTSPRFDIVETDGCKCELIFEGRHYPKHDKHAKRTSVIKANFFGTLQYITMQAKVSIIGKNGKKLCALQEHRRRTVAVNESLLLTFEELLTTEVVAPYLVNDTLKLLFELYLVKGIEIEDPVRTNTWDSDQAIITRERLEDMFKNSELCDFTFTLQGISFPVHKLVLAANSQVFQDMFQSLMDTPEICTTEIEDVDPIVFKTFLNYMYTGEFDEREELVSSLMALAEKYQVTELMKLCKACMMANLKMANADEMMLEVQRGDDGN